MDEVIFDPEQHLYWINGILVASVTQALGSQGMPDLSHIPDRILAPKRELGKAIHATIQYDNEGDLDEESVHPDVMPLLVGWRRFCKEKRFKPRRCELMVWSTTYMYAGHLDADGEQDGILTFADAKSGITAGIGPEVGVQLAGYEIAYRERFDIPDDVPIRRIGVQLSPGMYRDRIYEDPDDRIVFLDALGALQITAKINNWKASKGLQVKGERYYENYQIAG